MKPTIRRIAFAIAMLIVAPASIAQTRDYELTNLGSRVPSKQELIDALAVKPALPTRGGQPAPPPRPRAIASSIGFEFNSAALNEQGKDFLNNLGAALSDDALKSSRLVLEGHTDAKGGEEYNVDLSKKRAHSVREFLVTVWGVPGDHLSIVGKGKSDLLDPEHPEDGANRAVVIINTGLRNENK